jgi:hypothetical protein
VPLQHGVGNGTARPLSRQIQVCRRIPGILPPLTFQEAIETTQVHSVAGTLPPGGDHEALIADYARCAGWAADAGADVVEIHLAVPDPFAETAQMIFENVPLAAQILYRVRTSIGQPVVTLMRIDPLRFRAGVPERDVKHLFEAFHRGANAKVCPP